MADYVVTRKRKRYAVDPCLGYYMYAPSSDGRGETASDAFSDDLTNERTAYTGIDSRLQRVVAPLLKESYKSGDQTMRGNTDLSSQGARRNQAQLQEKGVVTVEAFLKGSTRTYKHRKLLRRQVNLNDRRRSADTDQAIRSSKRDYPRCPCTGNHEDEIIRSHRRGDSTNTRRCKNRKPLKERLYEAAILTHGEPDDYYTRSEAAENMASDRTALLFVPYEHASRDRATGTTHTKALIVDPRKSMAMQTASLTCRSLRGYTDSGLLSHTLDRIPLSKWNLTLNDSGHVKSAPKRKESNTTGDMASVAFAYPPLSFVSFQEAEKNYKNMFQGVGSEHFLKPHTLASLASTSSAAPEGANHRAIAHDCSGQLKRPSTAIPGILPGIPLTTTTSLRTSVASINSTNNVDIDEPLPGHPQPTAVLPHSVVSGEPSTSGAFGRAKEQSSLMILHKDGSPSLESASCSQTSDLQNDRLGNKMTLYKPLRPLGSFVNELLTVRRNSKI